MSLEDFIKDFRTKAITKARETFDKQREQGVLVPDSAMPRIVQDTKEEMLLEAIYKLQGVKNVKRSTKSTK